METIFSRFIAGDHQAFESLFDTFYDSGYNYLAGYVTDDDTIRDILQETFIGIWNNRHTLKSFAHFRIYFYKSLRNNAVRHLKRDRRTDILAAMVDHGETVLDRIERTEFVRRINEAVGLLSEERRKVIILSMNGLTVKDIAEELDISPNTVKTHKKLAYASLKKHLDRHLFSIFLTFF